MRKVCANCGRQMEDTQFYTYKNGEKTQLCKTCLTLHIDNFEPDTFVWILQKMDVPYVPVEWNKIRDKAYAKDPKKMNGMSVFGKYLSLMKLKQWKNYTWADTEKLQAESEAKLRLVQEQHREQQQKVKEQYQAGVISEAQYRTFVDTQTQYKRDLATAFSKPVDAIGENNAFDEREFISKDELPDYTSQLTLEEKQMLALKWGRTYRVSEWVQLQRLYTQMTESFDIHDADSKNALIFICKTNLKMNQALDQGDVQGYQKLSRVYDTLRKSAKFTAAQNKEDKAGFINSVGQLVAYCEKQKGQIPRYQIDTPQDIIDKTIQDLKEYNKSLIYQDTALARQIEDYIREAKAAAEKRKDQKQAKEKGLEAPELSDEDLLAYKDFLRKEKEATDEEMMKGVDNEFIPIN